MAPGFFVYSSLPNPPTAATGAADTAIRNEGLDNMGQDNTGMESTGMDNMGNDTLVFSAFLVLSTGKGSSVEAAVSHPSLFLDSTPHVLKAVQFQTDYLDNTKRKTSFVFLTLYLMQNPFSSCFLCSN